MSFTTITINGMDYPSYATIAEADTYLAVDLARNTDWAALDPEGKGLRLVAATRRMDGLGWAGQKASESQMSEWPRQGLFYETGDAVPGDAIPERLEQACILLAGGLAAGLVDASGDGSEAAIQSERLGPFAATYFHPRRQLQGRAAAGRGCPGPGEPVAGGAVHSRSGGDGDRRRERVRAS